MDRPKQYRQGAMLPERDQAACFWGQLKIIEQVAGDYGPLAAKVDRQQGDFPS